ncbi:hypothetical protein [Salinispora arenicola]|uniref:hypothetical protein n=1 Tax=Salinispora arenicola TaxID=168697 RepID=UPI0020796CD3|nr:hypothetical protein [Salinispora arenicola]MCN0151931.1 hypothetical protein [Salinispora arenicola]
MRSALELDGPDLLGWWIRQPNRRGRQRARRPTTSPPTGHPLRVGRMSTVDFQDRTSSCRWQRNHADDQIAGHGRFLVEFAATARAGCRW